MNSVSLKKINLLNNIGQNLFYVSLFLLPSAFSFSAILLLISGIIGFFNREESFRSDLWSKFFLVGGILIIISSFLNSNEYLLINKDSGLKILYPNLGIFNWLPFTFLFYGFQAYFKKYEQRRKSGLILLIGTVPVMFSVIGQTMLGWIEPIKSLNGLIVWYLRPLEDFNAVSGLFNNPNYLGTWLNIVFPFGLSYCLTKNINKLKKIIIYIFLSGIALAIFLTNSRSAWICIILTIPFFYQRKNNKYFLFLILLLFLMLLPILIISNQELFSNNLAIEIFSNFSKETYADDISRLDIWRVAVNQIIERPIWGSGSSSFPSYIQGILGLWKGHAHNLPLELMISYGIPAALFLIIPISYLLSSALKNLLFYDRFDDLTYTFDKAWITVLFILTISHLVDITYFDGRISIVGWISIASISNILKQNNSMKNNEK